MSAEELSLSVAGVEIAAKRWSNTARHKGRRPVIALHGWLDNAASFDKLAPLLDADVVALDLAGHGCSYHRPPQGSYNVWDDLPDIARVADQLGWSRFYLLGHSRGAIISALLSAALPERLLGSVLLDGLAPPPLPIEDTFKQLGRHLREHLGNPKAAARYESPQRALEVRCRVSGLDEAVALPIVERGLKRIGDDWLWRADPRLNYASAFKLSAEQIALMIRQLAAQPHLLLLAEQGVGGRMRASGELNELPLRCELLPGGHHFHLEPTAATIAQRVNRFFIENET